MNNENKQILDQVRAVIFDLDGVLVDTAIYHFKAWKRIAACFDFDFTAEHNEELKGVSRVESLNKILRWAGVEKDAEEKEALLTLKNSWYLEYVAALDANSLLPGSAAFLKQLKQAGKKIALGSASKNAVSILEKTGIKGYFDVIVDGNIVSASKPDPAVFLTGAERMGIQPQHCVVFEDAQAGVEAARSAGMFVIGVSAEGTVLEHVHGTVRDLSQMLSE